MSVHLSYFLPSIHPSVVHPIVQPCFHFPDDNLSKYQWLFIELSTCIDIVEIGFGIAKGQILSVFDRVICYVMGNYHFMFLFIYFFNFYTPPHDSGRVLWSHVGHPCVHLSVICPSVFVLG